MRICIAGGALLLGGLLIVGMVWLAFEIRRGGFSLERDPDPVPARSPVERDAEDRQAELRDDPARRRVRGTAVAQASGRFSEIERGMDELAPRSGAGHAAADGPAFVAIAEAIERRESLESMTPQSLARFLRASTWTGSQLSTLADLMDRERTQNDLAATYGKRAAETSDATTAAFWKQQEGKRREEAEKAKLLLDLVASALRDGDARLASILCGFNDVPASMADLRERVVDEIKNHMGAKLDARAAAYAAKIRAAKSEQKPNSER